MKSCSQSSDSSLFSLLFSRPVPTNQLAAVESFPCKRVVPSRARILDSSYDRHVLHTWIRSTSYAPRLRAVRTTQRMQLPLWLQGRYGMLIMISRNASESSRRHSRKLQSSSRHDGCGQWRQRSHASTASTKQNEKFRCTVGDAPATGTLARVVKSCHASRLRS